MNPRKQTIITGFPHGAKEGDEVQLWCNDRPIGVARIRRVIDSNTIALGPLPWYVRLWQRFKARFL